MLSKLQKNIQEFVSSKKEYPIVAAIAASLYSFLYVYDSNFVLVNSMTQFFVIVGVYILLPILVFVFSWQLVKWIGFLKKMQPIVIPVLNAAFFGLFFMGRMYGFHQRKIILAYIIGFSLLAIVLRKHYKKIIVIQYIMAIIAFISLLPTLFAYATHSNDWLQQPDTIVETKFESFPNVYVIQPDGYVNFSELAKDPYNFKNGEFESYLENKNFKLYKNFRSNYTSTVLSNSSMFGMKHHYEGEELYSAREVIVGNNPVVETFKNNGYETFLFMENPYLLLNRPEIKYDSCNFSLNEVPWFGFGAFSNNKKLIEPLEETIKKQQGKRSFYFIEKIAPGHITTFKNQALGKETERENYLEKLKVANAWLKEITSVILKNDPNSLIVIAADHGGYVGLNYTKELFEKQTDKKLVYSSFSAALAIKWPNNAAPSYDSTLKTPVNLFRTIFAYLGDNKALLQYIQDDKSYSIITKNAPKGVYEYIDNDGNVVFKKAEK